MISFHLQSLRKKSFLNMLMKSIYTVNKQLKRAENSSIRRRECLMGIQYHKEKTG